MGVGWYRIWYSYMDVCLDAIQMVRAISTLHLHSPVAFLYCCCECLDAVEERQMSNAKRPSLFPEPVYGERTVVVDF